MLHKNFICPKVIFDQTIIFSTMRKSLGVSAVVFARFWKAREVQTTRFTFAVMAANGLRLLSVYAAEMLLSSYEMLWKGTFAWCLFIPMAFSGVYGMAVQLSPLKWRFKSTVDNTLYGRRPLWRIRLFIFHVDVEYKSVLYEIGEFIYLGI